jgi:hypothetical protein
MDINKKKPARSDKNKEIKTLGKWIDRYINMYDINIDKCKKIMK